ncbi:Com family DNA-binding transcriptional regulator [Dichelobacter nodosus]
MYNLRCKQCQKLLAKSFTGKIEIKCPWCKTVSLYQQPNALSIQQNKKDAIQHATLHASSASVYRTKA